MVQSDLDLDHFETIFGQGRLNSAQRLQLAQTVIFRVSQILILALAFRSVLHGHVLLAARTPACVQINIGLDSP